jgi:hypothetical protein
MPIISAFRTLRQEDQELQVSLGSTVRHCLKKKKKKKYFAECFLGPPRKGTPFVPTHGPPLESCLSSIPLELFPSILAVSCGHEWYSQVPGSSSFWHVHGTVVRIISYKLLSSFYTTAQESSTFRKDYITLLLNCLKEKQDWGCDSSGRAPA